MTEFNLKPGDYICIEGESKERIELCLNALRDAGYRKASIPKGDWSKLKYMWADGFGSFAYSNLEPMRGGRISIDQVLGTSEPEQPAWNGEGLPPVGCECEILFTGDYDPKWWKIEVLFISNESLVIRFIVGNKEAVHSLDDLIKFRPIDKRTAKEKALYDVKRIYERHFCKLGVDVNSFFEEIAEWHIENGGSEHE